MADPFQAAFLVASPSYSNAVAWSDKNLVAAASGNLVTILNPAMLFGALGLITISASKHASFGLIERKDVTDLLNARCSSWCSIGFMVSDWIVSELSLLAVFTTEGRVKLCRLPFSEFSAEWVEQGCSKDDDFIYRSSRLPIITCAGRFISRG